MIPVSFAAAFAGGILSLLSPCSALLLPAFFAYAFSSRTQLVGHTLLFLAGLCTVFVPLGLGMTLVGALVLDHRQTTVLVAGLLLVALGALQFVGADVHLLPHRFTAGLRAPRGMPAAYGSGLIYGLAGFCAGPLLGGVLTVAASSGNPMLGAALLVTYALGTAGPLFLLAWLWDRYDLGHARWLRGRGVRVGPLHLHTTNILGGVLLILLGSSFVALQGGSVLSAVYDDLGLGDLGFSLQVWISDHVNAASNALILLVVGIVASVSWAFAHKSRATRS
jgi:cytochrome c biogenesis protein CcdA